MQYLLNYFSKTTLRKLAAREIIVTGSRACGPMFQDVAFELNDNGTHRVRTFSQVLAIAAGGDA